MKGVILWQFYLTPGSVFDPFSCKNIQGDPNIIKKAEKLTNFFLFLK
jgi:hypothetical protein